MLRSHGVQGGSGRVARYPAATPAGRLVYHSVISSPTLYALPGNHDIWVTPDDPRVKAAFAYITKNYSLDENPGMGQKGLYYYYQTFSKALALIGKPTLTDSQGTDHDWRAELTSALATRQNPDGSWVNKADQFMEGDPNLVTGYALLALSYCKPKK